MRLYFAAIPYSGRVRRLRLCPALAAHLCFAA